MDGKIWIESKKEQGSTFFFTVKLEQDKSSDIPTDHQPATKSILADEFKGNAILLVEDNPLNQELSTEILKMNGFSVSVASNGKEALQKLETENFDCVLMDCQMPVMDGYEATRQIRKQEKFRYLPVIALTANAMKGDKEKALRAGMNDHIAKPVDPDAMFSTIAKWINSDQPQNHGEK